MDTNSGTVLSEFSQRTLKIEIHYSKTNTNKTAKKNLRNKKCDIKATKTQ